MLRCNASTSCSVLQNSCNSFVAKLWNILIVASFPGLHAQLLSLAIHSGLHTQLLSLAIHSSLHAQLLSLAIHSQASMPSFYRLLDFGHINLFSPTSPLFPNLPSISSGVYNEVENFFPLSTSLCAPLLLFHCLWQNIDFSKIITNSKKKLL